MAYAADESITITTYYPSPYGVYNELRARRMAIGDNYYSPDYCWPSTSCTNQIDANADLVVQGNVGIGTNVPVAPFHVKLAVDGSLKKQIMLENLSADPDKKFWGIRTRYDLGADVFDIGPTDSMGAFASVPIQIMADVTKLWSTAIAGGDRLVLSGSKIEMIASNGVGIGTVVNPQAKLDVTGGVRIGDDPNSCSVSNEGTMRYHSGAIQFCNGANANWQNVGGGGGIQFSPILNGGFLALGTPGQFRFCALSMVAPSFSGTGCQVSRAGNQWRLETVSTGIAICQAVCIEN